MASFVVTIQSSCGKFLSCYEPTENTGLTLWTEDGSGRQRWVLRPSGQPDTYSVSVFRGRQSPRVLGASGGAPSLTGAGAGQTWLFKQINQKARLFLISAGGQAFLTIGPNGAVGLQPRLAQGAGAAGQQFKVLETGDAPPVVPKVFLGGAFQATQQDLANDPARWRTVAARCGYWAHPMGLALAKDQGWLPTLLSRFAVKRFVYEQDLQAWSDGSNPIQTDTPSCWGDWLRQADPSFQCEFYCPWVAGDRLAGALDDTARKYAQIRQRMDAAGYSNKGWFFYAPPSPEAIACADTLLNARRDGLCYVEHVVRAAGLKGVALDYPASLWLAERFPARYPPGTGDKCRALARQAHDVARRCGIGFAVVFNGSDASVAAALDSMTDAGLTFDYVGVDNFSAQKRRATPETDPSTVAGQARVALDWVDQVIL